MDCFPEHIRDLSERSERRSVFVFSQFLTLDERSVVIAMEKELCPVSFFGGTPGCERVMARFGSSDEFGYEEPFPIVCIKLSPLNKRFAEELTHRDILGAVMSLGLVRSQIGDIAVSGDRAFLFTVSDKAEYICTELKRIRHTDIKCAVTEFDENEPLYKTEPKTVICASDRLDCIVAAAYNLSRTVSGELFEGGRIFINGRQILSPSARPKTGDIVSVRGKGRFVYRGVSAETKKHRFVTELEMYV